MWVNLYNNGSHARMAVNSSVNDFGGVDSLRWIEDPLRSYQVSGDLGDPLRWFLSKIGFPKEFLPCNLVFCYRLSVPMLIPYSTKIAYIGPQFSRQVCHLSLRYLIPTVIDYRTPQIIESCRIYSILVYGDYAMIINSSVGRIFKVRSEALLKQNRDNRRRIRFKNLLEPQLELQVRR